MKTFLMAILAFSALCAAEVRYPVQEFRLGIGNTDRNLSGVSKSVHVASETFLGEKSQKWSLDYVRAGAYKIVNSETGKVLANRNGLAIMADDGEETDQCWRIVAVEKDFEGYDLYYKIVTDANPDEGLSLDSAGNFFRVEKYTGKTFQKFKINLDGLEGYAANAQVSGKEKAGTIGGLLGKTVIVSTVSDLVSALDSKEPLTVVLDGDIDMVNQNKVNQRIRDNKTLVGAFGNNTIYDSQFRNDDFYGKDAAPSNNIVIRNINFVARQLNSSGSGVILLSIYGGRNIWIDHNSFSATFAQDKDREVGKFIWINTPAANWSDSKYNGVNPDYITISYNYFKNRFWTVAFGSQNKDTSRLRTTLMFNKWEQCSRRTPQYSNGFHHNYSEYHTVTGSENPNASSQVIGGEGSRLLNENCRFEAYPGKELDIDRKSAISAHDNNSYASSRVGETPAKLKFTPLGNPWKASDSYGYHLVRGFDAAGNDAKTFTNKYSGCFKKLGEIRYVTDAGMEKFIDKSYGTPFLRSVEVGDSPLGESKKPTRMDTLHGISFRNANSGLYLSLSSGANSAPDYLAQTRDETLWNLIPDSSGFYFIGTGFENRYLHVENSKTGNGSGIVPEKERSGESGLFKFVKNEDGTFNITTKITSDQSCLGVAAASLEEGAKIVEWECNASSDQKWVVKIHPNAKSGNLITDLKVYDLANDTAWKIRSRLALDSLVFGDRSVVIQDVSEELVGAEFIQTACDSKSSPLDTVALFTAAKDLELYVALDSRVAVVPEWLSGFQKTGLSIKNSSSVNFDIYRHPVQKGEVVVLGANGQSSGAVNYFVLAKESRTERIRSPGLEFAVQAALVGKNLYLENPTENLASVSIYAASGKVAFKTDVPSRGKRILAVKDNFPRGVYVIHIQNGSQIIRKQMAIH